MTIRFSIPAAWIALAAAVCTSPAQALSFSFKALDSLGGTASFATSINDLGHVVGGAWTADNAELHATLWAGTNATYLGTLGGYQSVAYGINNVGQIVGVSYPVQSGNYRATLWQGTTATDLGTLSGRGSSRAFAINDAGQIVGDSDTGFSWDNHATLWQGNGVHDLGTLGGDYSAANAINNAGQIIGTSYTAGSALQRATRWNGTTATDLDIAPGSWTGGIAINDAGVMLAHAGDQPFVLNGGTTTALGSLGGASLNVYETSTFAWAINNAGLVVGFSHTPDHARQATLWDGTEVINLNRFLTMEDLLAGWELLEARDINNHGVIVGTASNKLTGSTSAFVLSPVPEPATWLMAAAAGVLAMLLLPGTRKATPRQGAVARGNTSS